MNTAPNEIAFDPRGVVETEPLAPAPRVAGLDGRRLGVLDNTKWNANRLLRKTVARLEQHQLRRGQLLPQGELFQGRRPRADRADRRRQRHRPDRNRRLRLVHVVLYA